MLAAIAYGKDLLENSDEGKFSIISHGRGKYGRVLGEIFVKGHETSVNELLKENGHAYEYHGGAKKVFGGWWMSELEESVVRSQAILMMARNHEKEHVVKRVLKRFLKCVRG